MDDTLRPDQLSRLFRDLDLTSAVALRSAAPSAARLAWLLANLRITDACTDVEMQQRLCRHVGVRGKLRTRKEGLYDLVESLKRAGKPGFEQVLSRVSVLTGQVEKSTASHLLSLFDQSQPVIDRDLRELLPRYGFAALGEAPPFDECVDYHRQLGGLFRQIIAAAGWRAASVRIDAAFGPEIAHALSDVLKAGLLLSHARRPIALLPSSAAHRPAAPAAATRPAATVTAAPGVPGVPWLHLCR
jgi:hypothetical protein